MLRDIEPVSCRWLVCWLYVRGSSLSHVQLLYSPEIKIVYTPLDISHINLGSISMGRARMVRCSLVFRT